MGLDDSILNYMANQVSSTDDMEIYFDFEGKKINGSTLPADIVTSLSRPDIVVINRAASPVEVYLYELTVSYERNVDDANIRKTNRYAGLEADIESNGFECSTVCFEIGQCGYINSRNKLALGGFLRLTKRKTKFRTFYQKISKISVLCSFFAIYCARDEPEWVSPRFLSP